MTAALPAALAALLLLTGCGGGSAASEADASASPTSSTRSSSAAPSTTAPPTPTQQELPGGGTRVFPEHRLVGFSGGPGSPALGPMTGDLAAATERLRQQAAPYGADRTVLPVIELIATTAHPFPTPTGLYATAADDAVVQQYLDAARAAGGILLLGIQPGTGDFLPAVQQYERWLTEPDVGVALDPEWAVDPGEVPGDVFGSTTGAELNSVSAYLDGLVTTHRLPQKVMLYHQLHAQIVTGQEVMVDRPGIAVVKSVDGIGAAADKVGTYQRVMAGTPPFVHAGFKLFYEEDTRSGPLMEPAEVLALLPQPEYVLYE
ncbi:hypothetical protein DMO24_03340 [Modestobacter versicolor]|uniref:Lipoprotein n=1 Tax=Modestobacter versicolor TaxID=429133 RepID=A0A323VDX6_9ACTN|nr:hypothetical protein [Modestobacter versicolor]PZA22781.1 hypothetical protein DMO24_03340 [Modestobacter versicolor]